MVHVTFGLSNYYLVHVNMLTVDARLFRDITVLIGTECCLCSCGVYVYGGKNVSIRESSLMEVIWYL